MEERTVERRTKVVPGAAPGTTTNVNVDGTTGAANIQTNEPVVEEPIVEEPIAEETVVRERTVERTRRI